MVVEKGYKQTEVGVIPEDWEVKTFKDVSYMKGRIGWQGLNQSEFTMNMDEPFLITGMNFKDGEIRWNEVYHISEERFKIAKEIQLKQNDVLMTKDGTIGKILFVDFIPYPYKASLNSHLLVFRPLKNSYSSKYLYYNLQSPYFLEHIELTKSGTTFFGVSQASVGEYRIILPPIAEQTAIATALSDMDELIAQTEELIEKKKAIKQGVMQELLRPKDGWLTKKLGDYGRTFGGITGKTKIDFGKGNSLYIPFMNIMSNPIIDVEYMDSVEIKPNESQNKVQKGDLFFNGSSETPEEVGLCSVLEKDVENVYLNSFCFGYRMHNSNEFNGLFVSYLFRSQLGRSLIFSLAQGATRYNLSKTNLLKLELPIPSKEVQDDIALTLLDIDNLIQSNMRKLNKLKLQKQGMMQALLTGKIRLV
jgi:type I restriction enzyme S subunit